MLSKLPSWLSGLIKSGVSVLVLFGAYAISQGGAWQTITLGGAALWLLHWLEAEFGVTPTA